MSNYKTDPTERARKRYEAALQRHKDYPSSPYLKNEAVNAKARYDTALNRALKQNRRQQYTQSNLNL